MSYSVLSTPNFDKELKRLSKNYSSLKADLIKLTEELKIKGTVGTLVFNNVYKIKIAISSTGKSKTSEARIFTFVQILQSSVTLFSIYTKN